MGVDRKQGIMVTAGTFAVMGLCATGLWLGWQGRVQSTESAPIAPAGEANRALGLATQAAVSTRVAVEKTRTVAGKTPTARVKGIDDGSCWNSSAKVNAKATPVPDGKKSPYQGYLCEHGHWRIVKGDRIMYIENDKSGKIVDRYWTDLQGNVLGDPKN